MAVTRRRVGAIAGIGVGGAITGWGVVVPRSVGVGRVKSV